SSSDKVASQFPLSPTSGGEGRGEGVSEAVERSDETSDRVSRQAPQSWRHPLTLPSPPEVGERVIPGLPRRDGVAELDGGIDLAQGLDAGAGAAHGDVAVIEQPAEHRLVDIDALDL